MNRNLAWSTILSSSHLFGLHWAHSSLHSLYSHSHNRSPNMPPKLTSVTAQASFDRAKIKRATLSQAKKQPLEKPKQLAHPKSQLLHPKCTTVTTTLPAPTPSDPAPQPPTVLNSTLPLLSDTNGVLLSIKSRRATGRSAAPAIPVGAQQQTVASQRRRRLNLTGSAPPPLPTPQHQASEATQFNRLALSLVAATPLQETVVAPVQPPRRRRAALASASGASILPQLPASANAVPPSLFLPQILDVVRQLEADNLMASLAQNSGPLTARSEGVKLAFNDFMAGTLTLPPNNAVVAAFHQGPIPISAVALAKKICLSQ
jgi:hypothetical protein